MDDHKVWWWELVAGVEWRKYHWKWGGQETKALSCYIFIHVDLEIMAWSRKDDRSQVPKCIINEMKGNNLKEQRFLKREWRNNGWESTMGSMTTPIPFLTWCYGGCGKINILQISSIPCKGAVPEGQVAGLRGWAALDS